MLALLTAAREPVSVGVLGNALSAAPDEVLLELARGLEERGLVELERGPPPLEARRQGFPPAFEEFLLSEPKTVRARVTGRGAEFVLAELARAAERRAAILRETADAILAGEAEHTVAAYYLRADGPQR